MRDDRIAVNNGIFDLGAAIYKWWWQDDAVFYYSTFFDYTIATDDRIDDLTLDYAAISD